VKRLGTFALLAALALAGCGGSKSDIGLLDVSRLSSNWPKMVDATTQMNADQQAIAQSREGNDVKSHQMAALQGRYAQLQDDLVKEVQTAAAKVAQDKHLKLIVTRENVGYGGVDITTDVEKELGFTEKASPSP